MNLAIAMTFPSSSKGCIHSFWDGRRLFNPRLDYAFMHNISHSDSAHATAYGGSDLTLVFWDGKTPRIPTPKNYLL